MRDKFGLDFRIVDSNLLKELRRRRGIHVNPWVHFPRLITSIDFLKRERPLRLFRETLPGQGEPIYPPKYDLLIVDEAHNCAPSGAGQYSADSLRNQALRELVPHFEHKLFLTAKPHNGYRESFSALLELLDNQRFSRGTEPDRKQLDAVMVRRLKRDPSFAFNHLGIRRFPPRVLEPIEVPYTSKLQPVTARVVPNSVMDTPAVIAHARLVLIGGDSHRLHEEIIAAGGLIKDQKWAGRLNVGQTAAAMEESLTKEPSGPVKAKLLELYPSLAPALASALEARMKQLVEGLQKKLADRAEKEASDIETILTELKKSIESELNEPAYIQPMLFNDPEKERFERNKEAMRTRVREIPEEIIRETEAIRARFADPQARMFPVAVTFIIPEKMAF